MEDFDMYREMCANRLRRLERYKKAKSFCSLEASNNQGSYDEESNSTSSTFDMIREKMFSLMENDMSLLQQLLTLGDQISEIKKQRLRRAYSQTSVDDYDEELEKEDRFESDDGFSASMSAVTNLYVDDDKPQFFSRQNSVLRIPIPPRSSNRFGARRVIRRPSEVRKSLHLNSASDDATTSSEDSGADSPNSHSPTAYSTITTIPEKPLPAKKNRSSNSSIDSGIRDDQDSLHASTLEREIK